MARGFCILHTSCPQINAQFCLALSITTLHQDLDNKFSIMFCFEYSLAQFHMMDPFHLLHENIALYFGKISLHIGLCHCVNHVSIELSLNLYLLTQNLYKQKPPVSGSQNPQWNTNNTISINPKTFCKCQHFNHCRSSNTMSPNSK